MPVNDTCALRLAAKTVKSDGCWLWTGSQTPSGYGKMRGKSADDYAHRIAWELASGEAIPDKLVVGHVCDTPPCTRNDEPGIYVVRGISLPRFGHLFLGTHAQNIADRDDKGRGVWVGVSGEARSDSKLTDETVARIRLAYARGDISQRELARQVGVHQSQIFRVIHRESWSHVQ